MKCDIKGKVVVITGGAGRLGREFVRAVEENGGIAVSADLQDGVDINSKDSLIKLIEKVRHAYGRIDALINCAYPKNKNFGHRFEEVAREDYCENLDLHLGGYFLTAQQFALFFLQQGHGNIINIASIYGVIPPRFELYEGTTMSVPLEYAVIKAGIIQMTRYLAQYFKGRGIRVNAVSPGGILDKQPEVFLKKYNAHCAGQGMLESNDLNGTILFLLSDSSRCIDGQNLIVDDGFNL